MIVEYDQRIIRVKWMELKHDSEGPPHQGRRCLVCGKDRVHVYLRNPVYASAGAFCGACQARYALIDQEDMEQAWTTWVMAQGWSV